MQDFIKYIKTADAFDEATKWRMLLSVYIDPDSKSIQYVDGIPCNADGLISLRRLYCRYGMTEKLVEDYRKYRAVPIIHFPSAVNGINMLRASVFGDRIDHTLYDLKRHCEGANDCRLQSAYRLPRTQRWLQFLHCDFGEIVKWMGIDGVFVGKENEVFDLESGDGKPVTQYKARYTWDWDDAYYEHLTNKILQFRRESRREKSRSL